MTAPGTTEPNATDPAETETQAEATEVETKPDVEIKATDWQAEARKWEKRAKDNMAKLKTAEPKVAEYDKLAAASKTELERATDAAKASEGRLVELTLRTIKAEVRAKATASFIDPDVPFAYLDMSSYATDDGDIDADKIDADLTDLLKRKPALAKGDGRRLPAHNPAQGSSANGAPDLAAQIEAARKASDWTKVIALENQKLAAPTG